MLMDSGKASAEELLSVVTYNIHSCMDFFRRENPRGIAQVIRRLDPDVVALQEVAFLRRNRMSHIRNQAEWIASHLNMHCYFYPLRPMQWGFFGLALLSKRPLTKVKTALLPEDKRIKEVRGAMWYGLETSRGRLHIINTHLALGPADRLLQIQRLLSTEWLGQIPAEEAVVFCGDLNAAARSPIYRLLSEKYQDVQTQTRQWGYPRMTFISFSPLLRLDHIFISRHLKTLAVKVPFGLSARIASDHLPLLARLAVSNPG